MKKGMLGAKVSAIIIIGGILGSIICTSKIPAGYAGVVYNMNGGIEDKLLTQGWHIVAPWKKVRKYSIATEQAFLSKDKREGSKGDDSFLIPSKDGKTLFVDMEFSYRYIIDKLPETYTRFKGQNGEHIEQTFIKGKMKAYATEVSSKFSVLDIYGEKRSELNKELLQYARNKFREFGIEIESVNFTRIDVDAQTSKAIQNRINAQQNLEKQKIDLETAKIQAAKAKVDAESKAQVVRIGAKAEAEANKLKQQTINPVVVEYEKVKKWDGKLPQVQGGQSIVDIRKNTTK